MDSVSTHRPSAQPRGSDAVVGEEDDDVADEMADRLLAGGLPRDHAAEAQALALVERRLLGRSTALLTVGRYVLLRCLGSGSWGSVYAAYDPKLDRQVAIKLIGHGRGTADDAVSQVAREARALARLAHPNVIAVHDVGALDPAESERLGLPSEAGAGVFIVMELVNGITLADWLRVKRRHWREVLDALVHVARGLVAAHAEGVIHRDVKPANILIGTDGRVRVADFGLARRAVSSTGGSGPHDSTIMASAIAGTPAYMAPEQHLGQPLDGRADQYALCVTAWEALVGERPFSGSRNNDVLAAKLEGPPSISADSSVPIWLRAVLRRGLSVDPDERFASLDDMVDAIDRGRRPGRRRLFVLLGMGAAALGVVGLGVLATRSDPPEPCAGQRALVSGIWDEARRAAIREQLAGTGRPFAETTWRSLAALLDRYVERWVDARTAVCRATFVERDQSRAVLAYREECLDTRLARVEQLLSSLSRSPGTAAQHAVAGAEGLPSPDDCLTALPPGGEGSLPVKSELERALGAARASAGAADWRSALARAERVERRAVAERWPIVVAEALLVQADALTELGEPALAEPRLRRALGLAIEAGDAPQSVRVVTEQIQVIGRRLGRFREAELLYEIGAAQLRRRNLGDELDAALAFEVGAMRYVESRFEDSLELHERALQLRRRVLSPDDTRIAAGLGAVGLARYELGQLVEARAALEDALAMYTNKLGRDHPSTATVLLNLSLVDAREGDPTAALSRAEEALKIRRRTLEPEHHHIARTLVTIGNAQYTLGRFDEAATHHEQAVAMLRDRPTVDYLALGMALVNAGNAHAATGDTDLATQRYDEVLRLYEGKLPADDPRWGYPLVNRASLHLAGERPEAALDDTTRVLERIEPARPRHPIVAAALALSAGARRALGQTAGARRDLQRAERLYEALGMARERADVAAELADLGAD